MKRIVPTLILLGALFAVARSGPAGQAAGAPRVRDVLPAGGLIESSVAPIRDQADLDAFYYLADETVLGLGGEAEAVFAAYETGDGDALVLAALYPAEADAAKAYVRFGLDFFPEGFDPGVPRFLARLETGDWGAAVRVGRVLAVVLEAPGRTDCEALLGRLEERAAALVR